MSDEIWFVKFFAPWCEDCQANQPEWEKVASHFRGVINIAMVDVTVDKDLAKTYNISETPSLIFFGAEKQPVLFSGNITSAPDMVDFAYT